MNANTVKGYFRNGGKWIVDCDTSNPYRVMNVDVYFMNNGEEDKTQFSIKAYDTAELEECFHEFCKDNNVAENSIYAIYVVEVAETMNQLS